MMEVRWQHAGDGVEVAIHANFPAHDVRVGAEAAVPVSVADDHRFGESGEGIARRVGAAKLGVNAQHREVVGVGPEEFDAFGTLAAGDICVGGEDDGNVLKHAGTVTQVPELGNRHPDVVRVGAAHVVVDAHELFGMGKGQRPQKHSFDDGKDGHIGADAESEREDSHECESRAAPEHPPGMAKILVRRFDPPNNVHGARLFFQQRRIAKAALRVVAGFLGRHSRREVVLGAHLDVRE